WGKVSKPALTRPMVVMVVALDDCTRSVTTAPQKEPRNGVAAALLSTVRSAEPASAFSPPVMTVMPSRNRPTPPRTDMVVDMHAPIDNSILTLIPPGDGSCSGGCRIYDEVRPLIRPMSVAKR